jgi:hypothetical protein
MFAIACGKDNKSGATNNPQINGLVNQETQLREDFIQNGKNIIRRYGSTINLHFRQNISSRIVQVLVSENILFTETVIYPTGNYNKVPMPLIINNSMATFYIGQQYPNANWNNYLNQNQKQNDRIILHILLEMIGINDSNYTRPKDELITFRYY